MSRIKLLQPSEIRAFDTPIIFNDFQQNHLFTIGDDLEIELNKLRYPCSKMGYLLQWGYFKFHGRFYEVADFKDSDISYVAKRLGLNLKNLDFYEFYNKQMAYDHRERVLSLIQWRPFDEDVFRHQIERLVEAQLIPRKVLWETRAYLYRQGIEAPAYDKYVRVISETLIVQSKRINETLEKYLTDAHRLVLDKFLAKKSPSQQSEIVGFKIINQSTRPHAIKKSLEQFTILKARLEELSRLIDQIKLSDETIEYHAQWVGIAESKMIREHSDKYLYLICFLIRQVRLRQDFFIDIVLKSVNTAENQAKRLQKEDYFQDKKKRQTGTQLLIDSRKTYKQQNDEVKIILKSPLNNDDKVVRIEEVFEVDTELTTEQLALVSSVEDEVTRDVKVDFYRLWQQRSIWLSNRIGQIVIQLIISQENTDKNLFEGIKHYTDRHGKIKSPTKNIKWLDHKQQDLLWEINENGEEIFQRRLYKMFLFQAINDGIKSGILNFNQSYRYRYLEEYLISKQEWKTNKGQLLTDAEMTHLTDNEGIMADLEKQVDTLFHQVNDNYNLGINTYLKFGRRGTPPDNKPIITTPPIEKPDLTKLNTYYRHAHYVSILDLLADVEKAAPFLHHLGHQSKIHEKKRPTAETFFASIIALGCNIGVEKMRNISKGIQVSTLQNTTDWYLSLQALQDINDAIIKIKNDLDLPEIHRKNANELHTASDGQKFLVKDSSLNASYSYKYSGYTMASVVNTAVDERFALFSAAVVTASDREAISMVDMHLGNPVVKSTIHSTDTHGTSEVVFGIMYLLDIYFAPRIKDIASLQLFGFINKKEYADLDYELLPDQSINTALIQEHWGRPVGMRYYELWYH